MELPPAAMHVGHRDSSGVTGIAFFKERDSPDLEW
jgi:hypothetical protein